MSERVDPQFRADVIAGLKQYVPSIPARWLYDLRGSELFDEITRLPTYYPTRTEMALLDRIAPEIADGVPPGTAVVEFGAGSATKTPILLRAVQPAAYVPIDISGDYLRDSAAIVAADFPAIDVIPVEGDFAREVELPAVVGDLPKLGFFPGSTIGNFVPRSATDLLRGFRDMLGAGAQLLIGMDRVKPVERLIAAYDDPQGVTAAFNLNLVERMNRELETGIPKGAFRHEARWNDMLSRIEMHLVATREVRFEIAGESFAFAPGSSIHTENSHKYDQRGGRLLLLAGSWTPVREWTDDAGDFAIILAEALPERSAP
jgi:L-histidine N-alpha-methyltransferase